MSIEVPKIASKTPIKKKTVLFDDIKFRLFKYLKNSTVFNKLITVFYKENFINLYYA